MSFLKGNFYLNKYIIGFLILICVAISVFLLHPSVTHDRIVIPSDILKNQNCDCRCISSSRPWYSIFNYWFWLWMVSTPFIILIVKPSAPKYIHAFKTIFAIALGYWLINLSVELKWQIINDPFLVNNNYDRLKTWDMPCANIADGANLVFTLFFGWVLVCIYYAFYESIYSLFGKWVSFHYNRDIITKANLWLSVVLIILMLLLVAVSFFKGAA